MNVGLIVLAASLLVAVVLGALLGYGFSERKRAVRARRQAAAQTFLYRQLHELQAARQRGRSAQPRPVRIARERVNSYS
jgi:Flp pilus assembly protein TadB